MSFYRKSRRRVQFDSGTQMVTKQSHKAECDIHNILRQFQRTGIITHVQNARPTYMDLPSDVDFQQALETMRIAEEAFADLPAAVRSHFENDPKRFLSAFDDPSQEATLRSFGLLTAQAPQAPSPAQDSSE